jgi:hypothetical protein
MSPPVRLERKYIPANVRVTKTASNRADVLVTAMPDQASGSSCTSIVDHQALLNPRAADGGLRVTMPRMSRTRMRNQERRKRRLAALKRGRGERRAARKKGQRTG